MCECGKFILYSDERRSIAQQTCETKFVTSKISCPPPAREMTINHVPSFGRATTTANWSTWDSGPRIIFRYFDRLISTFCPTSTLKSKCMFHWTAEIETTGHKLCVQRKILWVNACFVRKFDSFRKDGFVAKLAYVSYLVFYYNTVGQTYQNSLKSRVNSPGLETMIRSNVQEYLFGK